MYDFGPNNPLTPPFMSTDLYLTLCALVLAAIGLRKWRRPQPLFPPGPKGYPVIGNLFDMPSKLQWEKYFEWSKKYSELRLLTLKFG